MPVPTSSLHYLLISTQETIRVYKHIQQSLFLTAASEKWLLWGMRAGWEPGVTQPHQSPRTAVALGRATPPAPLQPVLAQPASNSARAIPCPAHSRLAGALLPVILIPRATLIFCQFYIHSCFQKFQFSVYTCFTPNNHWERQYYHALISYQLLAKTA